MARAAACLAIIPIRLARRLLERRIGGAFDPHLSRTLDRLVVAEEALRESREIRP